jgi:hypothetical protein
MGRTFTMGAARPMPIRPAALPQYRNGPPPAPAPRGGRRLSKP